MLSLGVSTSEPQSSQLYNGDNVATTKMGNLYPRGSRTCSRLSMGHTKTQSHLAVASRALVSGGLAAGRDCEAHRRTSCSMSLSCARLSASAVGRGSCLTPWGPSSRCLHSSMAGRPGGSALCEVSACLEEGEGLLTAPHYQGPGPLVRGTPSDSVVGRVHDHRMLDGGSICTAILQMGGPVTPSPCGESLEDCPA